MSDEDDDAGGAPAGEADADTIARATEMGWVSPENWKGTPPKQGFLDPAEFVRRGEKVMPLINARAKKAEAELAELREVDASARSRGRRASGHVMSYPRSARSAASASASGCCR